MTMTKSLQECFAPNNRCFGCGQANEKGLQLKSYVEGAQVIARFRPQEHHLAFPGILNGGIIGTILDCHSLWCACDALMKAQGLSSPPSVVTASFQIKLKDTTPVDKELVLIAEADSVKPNRVHVSAKLMDQERVTATCNGLFVVVEEGHPAHHNWQ